MELDEDMVTAGATAAVVAAAAVAEASSSHRVKFRREEFLELVEIAKPRITYHRRRMRFFAFDGFVMYTFECKNSDFKQKVLDAIEFSNRPWDE